MTKYFYKYMNSKRRARKILHPLLDTKGNTVTKDQDKAEVINAFFSLVFNSRTSYSLVSWFYDFWLSVFHIITSCSTLGIKDCIDWELNVPVPEKKSYYILHIPEDFVLFVFLFSAQGER